MGIQLKILKTHTYRCSSKEKVASTRRTSPLISSSEVSQPPCQRLLSLQLKESSSSFRSRTTSRTFQPTRGTTVSLTASGESTPSREPPPSGEATSPTSFVTSRPRLSISPARTSTRRYLTHTTPRRSQASSSSVIAPPVVLLVRLLSASCTLLTFREPVWPLMSDLERQESSRAWSTA